MSREQGEDGWEINEDFGEDDWEEALEQYRIVHREYRRSGLRSGSKEDLIDELEEFDEYFNKAVGREVEPENERVDWLSGAGAYTIVNTIGYPEDLEDFQQGFESVIELLDEVGLLYSDDE